MRRRKRTEDQASESMVATDNAKLAGVTNGGPNGHGPEAKPERCRSWDGPPGPVPCPTTPPAPSLEPAMAPPCVQPDEEGRGAHVREGEALTDVARGAHVMKGDPLLSVERRALHALKADALSTTDVGAPPPQTASWPSAAPEPVATGNEVTATTDGSTPSTGGGAGDSKRRRRWPLVPVAGAAGVLAAGLASGAAFAYFTSTGSGTGHAPTASPVTITVTATTGAADLLPGGTGAAYFTLHNTNPFGVTFNQVAPGTTVTSNNTLACPTSNVSIAPALPYTFSPAVTVSAGGTSGTESIAGLVALSASAPSSCQGVTFTVTFTLSGQST